MSVKPKVVIVDDHDGVRKSLDLWLQAEGFIVFATANGQEALQIASTEEIALCLIDLKLRDENGLQICQQLAKINRPMKLLMLSGYPEYETAILALKPKVAGYISKTENHDRILAKIKSALA